MAILTGRLYDGATSTARSITVQVDEAGYLSSAEYPLAGIHFDQVTVAPRVGNSPRFVDLPDGSRLETADHEQLDLLLTRWQAQQRGLAHRLETGSRWILLSVVTLVVVVYLAVAFGIPALSKTLTAMLPTSLDDRLGGEVLQQLDGLVFEPSSLSPDRQAALRDRFEALVPGTDRDYRIGFRSSELLGANAIALPDAQIIFTDQLVELADDDQMLDAIMLHEIGHVQQRHAMRAVIGQAQLSMLVFAVTGDINSASSALVIMLPGFFVQSRYSRELEWEADGYALEEMLRRDMDTEAFATIMERMLAVDTADGNGRNETGDAAESPTESPTESSNGTSAESTAEAGQGSLLDYFQSHPLSELRIARFREAAAN